MLQGGQAGASLKVPWFKYHRGILREVAMHSGLVIVTVRKEDWPGLQCCSEAKATWLLANSPGVGWKAAVTQEGRSPQRDNAAA